MGKVKSAIITALLLAAIVVLAFFATVSIPSVPGSGGTQRYNSFVSAIKLGGDFTGDAYTVVYPAGVITEQKYKRDTNENEEKSTEYAKKYVKKNGLYVDSDKLGDDDGAAFAASVKADAEILSDRLAKKGYSSYTVSVENGYAIKISVPAVISVAEYKQYMDSGLSAALSQISNTVTYLTVDGGLTLRSAQTYEDNNSLYFEKEEYEFNKFFKSANAAKYGGTSVLEINLTKEGVSTFNNILANVGEDGTAYLFIGKTCLNLTFNGSDTVGDKLQFSISGGDSYASDYAIAIDSAAHGKMLTNTYNDSELSSQSSLIAQTPVYGQYAPVWLAVLVIIAILAAGVCPIVKYKKLGLVNLIMVCAYAVSLTTAIFLTGTELTFAGVLFALLGLAVMCFSNFYTFEAVRKETALGRTISAAVKTGYKRSLFGILDLHVILIVSSVIATLAGVGELASCGLIFLIGSIASYVLYWFTRFMWFVISSPVKDKFAFCGYAREVEDDE